MSEHGCSEISFAKYARDFSETTKPLEFSNGFYVKTAIVWVGVLHG